MPWENAFIVTAQVFVDDVPALQEHAFQLGLAERQRILETGMDRDPEWMSDGMLESLNNALGMAATRALGSIPGIISAAANVDPEATELLRKQLGANGD